MADADLPELPELMWLRILKLLPLRDRLRVASVCRRWRDLVRDRAMWGDVDLRQDELSTRPLWRLVRRWFQDNLRALRLRGLAGSGINRRLLTPALLKDLRTRCPQLRCLAVDDADLRSVPYDSLPPSLTRLELSCCLIPDSWFCCWAVPQLQHLIVRNINTFESHHLLNVASHYSLKTLSVSGFLNIDDTDIEQAAPDLEGLEHFVLCGSVITDSAMDFIGRHMRRLRFLEIRSARSLANAGLDHLTSLQHLETLGLDLSNRISLGAVIVLCQALPQLRNLRLAIPHSADENEGVETLAQVAQRGGDIAGQAGWDSEQPELVKMSLLMAGGALDEL